MKTCKKCSTCKEAKVLTEFHKSRSRKDGLHPQCKDCRAFYTERNKESTRAKNREYYLKNREVLLAKAKDNYDQELKKEYDADYRQVHAARISAYLVGWRNENKGRVKSYATRAKKQRRLRIPAWSEREQIVSFYENCPRGYHVDHIIPLQGRTVSGLHVLLNLQYLSASENLQKSNKF